MHYILCLYDLDGTFLAQRKWSCIGCGWKHRDVNLPYCMRKGSLTGQIVRETEAFIKIKEKVAKKNAL